VRPHIGATVGRVKAVDEAAHAASGNPLPSFRDPPVVEVVLGVAFDPSLAALRTVDIYDFYQSRHRAHFPDIEEKPPYAPPLERFGAHARMPEIQFQVFDRPVPPMHWFISSDGSELVQVQRDWFARNWRRRDVASEYPRYPRIRVPFEEDLRALSAFVEERKLGRVAPRQCEITYVNRIYPNEIWQTHGDVSKVMRNWAAVKTEEFSPSPEQVQFAISYVIPDASQPVGRLHVVLQPSYEPTSDQPLFVLTLTARGVVVDGSLAAAMAFLDTGHEWIVRCFADITSEPMQAVWGREKL
jgi:uncharacterized protein (TIGR04255 family)